MKAAGVDFSHCLEKKEIVDLYMLKLFKAPVMSEGVDEGKDKAPVKPTINPHTVRYATRAEMLDDADIMNQMQDIVRDQTAEIEPMTAARYVEIVVSVLYSLDCSEIGI